MGDPLARQRLLDRPGKDSFKIVRRADLLVVDRHFAEEPELVDFLGSAGSDLVARDLAGDRQNRHMVQGGIVETVQEVDRSRSLASHADRKLSRKFGLGAGGEGAGLLVTHHDEMDRILLPERLHQRVDRVSRNPEDLGHSAFLEELHDAIAHRPCHGSSL